MLLSPTDLTCCSNDPSVGTCSDFSHDLQNLCSSEASGKMRQGTERSHGQDAAWWHKGEESEWGMVLSGIPEPPLSFKKWDLCFRICSGLVFVTPVSGVGVKLLLVQLGLQRLRGSWTVPSPKHPQPGFGLSLHLPQVGLPALAASLHGRESHQITSTTE